jgi:hypothetical protein
MFYMRKRQNQPPLMSEPDMDPVEINDPEALLEMEEDKRPLMSSFGIASSGDDDNDKPLSLWPRNYSGRRRIVVIAGFCFLFAVVALVKNLSGKPFLVSFAIVFRVLEGRVFENHGPRAISAGDSSSNIFR